MVQRPARGASPWLAVAGVCAVYFSFGLSIGVMGPMIDEISADLRLSRSTMGAILGAWALVYVFTAVPAGAVVDRLGLRWSLTVGGLAIALSLLLRSAATGAVTLFCTVAVFGIGGPLVSIATPKLVASMFAADRRRLPTGLGVAAPSLGTATGLATTNPILLPMVDGSWRGVLLIAAGVAVVATVGWLVASRAVAAVPISSTHANRGTLARLLRLGSFRRVLTVALFSFFFSHALNNWLPEILSDSGQSDAASGYLSAVSVLVGIVGSLAIARLVPSRHRPIGLVTIFAILAIGVSGLTALPVAPLYAALAIIGFCRAGIMPLLFLEIMGDGDISVGDMGAATGLFFAVGELGGFSGPYAIGFVADRTDGFAAATLVLASVSLAAAVAAWSLSLQRQRVTVA